MSDHLPDVGKVVADPTKVLDEIERLLRNLHVSNRPWRMEQSKDDDYYSEIRGHELRDGVVADYLLQLDAALVVLVVNNAEALVAIARGAQAALLDYGQRKGRIIPAMEIMARAFEKLGEAQP